MLIQFESTLKTGSKLQSDTNQVRPAQDDKKSAFLAIFLLTIFVITLKYPYVSQQANATRS